MDHRVYFPYGHWIFLLGGSINPCALNSVCTGKAFIQWLSTDWSVLLAFHWRWTLVDPQVGSTDPYVGPLTSVFFHSFLSIQIGIVHVERSYWHKIHYYFAYFLPKVTLCWRFWPFKIMTKLPSTMWYLSLKIFLIHLVKIIKLGSITKCVFGWGIGFSIIFPPPYFLFGSPYIN